MKWHSTTDAWITKQSKQEQEFFWQLSRILVRCWATEMVIYSCMFFFLSKKATNVENLVWPRCVLKVIFPRLREYFVCKSKELLMVIIVKLRVVTRRWKLGRRRQSPVEPLLLGASQPSSSFSSSFSYSSSSSPWQIGAVDKLEVSTSGDGQQQADTKRVCVNWGLTRVEPVLLAAPKYNNLFSIQPWGSFSS